MLWCIEAPAVQHFPMGNICFQKIMARCTIDDNGNRYYTVEAPNRVVPCRVAPEVLEEWAKAILVALATGKQPV